MKSILINNLKVSYTNIIIYNENKESQNILLCIMANNVISYFQFSHEVDDPNGKYHEILGTPEEGVVNIWTIPIFCFNKEFKGPNSLV